jgi:pseudaminic acid cytidylyltransferase
MRVAIIPARGGSRRIQRKNIRPFFGRPIISYSITTALESGLFDGGVYVSTDDDEIARVAEVYNAEVLIRPYGFERDEVGTQMVMQATLHQLALSQPYAIESACCIYPTAPMLTPQDLLEGYRAMKKRVARFAMSVGTDPLRDAGCYYWGLSGAFVNGDPLISTETVMVPLEEQRVCDVNTMDDWERAERMYQALRIKEAA